MKIINNYEGSSIDIISNSDNKIIVSPKSEKDGYSNYYNFIVSNLCNKDGILVIKNLNKMKYIPSEYNLLYRDRHDNYVSLDKSRISINKNNVEIKIQKNEELEISSYPRYTTSDLESFLKNNNISYSDINGLKKIVFGSGEKTIFIVGRQHPGETLSSFFIEGIIEYLNSIDTDEYSFMIFPIVSVNGVKNGCHRFTGKYDYNRMWNTNGLISEIDYIKSEIDNSNIHLFIDVHGDEIDDLDYIRTRMKLDNPFAGIQVLRDRSMIERVIRELVKHGKIPNFSNKTSREYIASIYKCDNILVELSLCKSSPKKVKEEGTEFIKKLVKGKK